MGFLTRKSRHKKSTRRKRVEPRLEGSAKPVAERRRRRRSRPPLVFSLLSWLMTVCLWGAIALAGVTAYVFVTLDQKGLFTIPGREPGMMILAADGTVVAERGAFFGDEARLSELPSYVPNAVIAIEDRRFRDHFGIDPIGLARAMYANYRAGRVVQGGSTLTQQLAKNLFLKPEKTLERKFYEAVLALWLESKYSKDEILQLYLNRVYFGAGAIGIEKAAKKYFGKSARELSLGEAATLAGLLRAPSKYNPRVHPERAAERARLTLAAMVETGMISEQEAAQAHSTTSTVKPADYIPATQYIVDWVAEQLPDLIGRFDESVVVETTLDRKLQALAEKVVRQRLAQLGKKRKVSEGAMVVMSPTGAVKAMVGGKSYKKSQFNRAVKAKRQPGSAFKPFVYLTAIEQGLTPETIEIDEPVKIGKWRPANYSKKYRGPVTLRTALALSLNSVAAKLASSAGPENVVTVAHRMGINSELKPNASIALGTSEVTLLELTAAYAPFANGGRAVLPYIVTRISSRTGKVLYERRGSGLGAVVSQYDIGAMNDMLRTVVRSGTGRRARLGGHDIAGKTGTSQDYRDAWFIGYSSYLVAGVWVGNDDNSPTGRVTGGNIPAMIWRDVMSQAHRGLKVASLPNGQYRAQDDLAFGNGGFLSALEQIFGGGQRGDSDAFADDGERRAFRRQNLQEARERNRRRMERLQQSK